MSTRSNIAIELPDGKVKSIYVHSDGYPNGVGHCLLEHYNDYKKARALFKFGNASYLGSTLKECSFYERDWGREPDAGQSHNNEWCLLNCISGDCFIEYVYLFKKGHWYVSEQKSIKVPKDHHDQDIHASMPYLTNLVRIEDHPHYKPDEDKGKPTEAEMVGKIGEMLNAHAGVKVITQGWGKRKKMN